MTAGAPRWVHMCSLAELSGLRMLRRQVEGVDVLVCRVGSEILAIHNVCTHLGKRLDGGRLMSGQIQCPFHGACFDLRTGHAVSGPAVFPLHRFAVRTEGDELLIDLAVLPVARGFASP